MLSGASIELKTCNAALLEAAGKSWEEVKILYPSVYLCAILYKIQLFLRVLRHIHLQFIQKRNSKLTRMN